MRAWFERLEKQLHSIVAIALAIYYRNRVINILDLDNTLVLTRQFQIEKGCIDVFGDKGFPSFTPRARNFYSDCLITSPTFILTARPYKTIFSTRRYLFREANLRLFFLCRSASLKMVYLYYLNKFCAKVNYYDDLSYGNTKIKLYDDLIKKVKKFERIQYYGMEYINENIL